MSNHLYDTLFAPHRDNDAEFLSDPLTGRSYSYRTFLARAAQMAHALQAAGLRPGDRIAVQAEKSPEMVMLYVAVMQSGAVFLPLNTAYTGQELDYFITDAAPRLVVCDGAKQDILSDVAERMGATLLTLNADGTGSLSTQADGQSEKFDTVPRKTDDLAALLYTSGTTGRSKGAMLTHRNLVSNTELLVEAWQITAQDHMIHALPIFHTHGLFVALNTIMLVGGRVTFLAKFDLDQIIASLPGATLMMGVPTFYTRLLADPRLTRELVATMRLFTSGSAPLLAETHEAFTARTGHAILERYGMTETNMSTSNPYAGERKPGTVGLPLPGIALRLSDRDTGVPLPQGEVGIIEVKGDNVFKGYWNMPEKTAEEFREDGYFITGDLARIDEDGYVTIIGRDKDLIITGGLNVYPKELEELLNAQEGVLESAVFSRPHDDFGEEIIAALVAQPGAKIDLDQIRAAVSRDLARFKHPCIYHILDALPRNAMGKVQKNILRAEYG